MWRCSCVSLNLSPEIVGAILAEFLRDLTATFNQLATPWTAVRILVGAIEDRSGVGEKFAKPVDHQAFQIASRYPPAARTGPSRSGDEGSRNILPIARSLLDRMGWRQALAGFVKNHAGQQAGVACARSRCPLNPVCGQHGLHIVPQWLVDNRRLFSGIGIAFVGYLAAVKTVLKDQIKCPAGERLAPIFGAVGPRSALALDPGVRKRVPQRVNRLEREIAPVDLDNNAGLGVVDNELAVFDIVPEGRHAAHPHALFLGG